MNLECEEKTCLSFLLRTVFVLEIRALAVIKLNKPVTPKQINDCVGTGDYAAKYVSFLNTRYGFTIVAKKAAARLYLTPVSLKTRMPLRFVL
jgi:hypothetical protein